MTVKRTTIWAHPTNFYRGRHKNGTTPAFVQFIVIHDGETDEGATAAEGMANWFATDHGAGNRSSAHQSADTDSICTSVRDQDTAFGAPGVNVTGWHLEHAGRAGQTASQWDDAASRLILANGALAAAEASVRLAPLTADRKPIPAVWLTDAQLRAAQADARIKGFITHRQVSRVLGGSHTDPGPNFPADRYMQLVRSHLNNGQGDWFDMADIDDLRAAVKAELGLWQIKTNDPSIAPDKDGTRWVNIGTYLGRFIARRADIGYARDQLVAANDPAKLAAALGPELAKALPSGTAPVSDAQLESALRTVLGSLDNTPQES